MSLSNLALAAKFNDVNCHSTVRAWKIFLQSRIAAQHGVVNMRMTVSVKMRLWAEMMEFLESIIKIFFRNAGEELKLIGKKNG